MARDFQQIAATQLQELFAPLVEASEDPEGLKYLFHSLGWNLDGLTGVDSEELAGGINGFVESLSALQELIDNPPDSILEIKGAIDTLRGLTDSLTSIRSSMATADLAELDDFVSDLVAKLVSIYLRNSSLSLFNLLKLLAVISDDKMLHVNEDGVEARFPSTLPQMRLSLLKQFLSDPYKHLKQIYLPDTLDSIDQVEEAFERLESPIIEFLGSSGFDVKRGRSGAPQKYDEVVERRLRTMLMFTRELHTPNETPVEVGAVIGLVPEGEEGPGLLLSIFGELSLNNQYGPWSIELRGEGDIEAMILTADGVNILSEGGSYTVALDVSYASGDEMALNIGGTRGTRIEIGDFEFSAEFKAESTGYDYDLIGNLKDGVLVIDPGDGDGLIQKMLPIQPIRVNFDLGLGFSKKKDFYLVGGVGFSYTIALGKRFGPFFVSILELESYVDGSGLELSLGLSGGAKVGPVSFELFGMGIKSFVDFDKPGIFGDADIEVDFKFPDGVSLELDAAGFSGGGFLLIDKPDYAGGLNLLFGNKVSLTAFGLISTQVASGTSGVSVIIQILVEFTPIQLGLGFVLTGVGGLIGLNRRMHTDNLRLAIKNHTLDTILFPKNPITDSSLIISSMQSVFPAEKNTHLFGPMVQMFWGGTVRIVEFEVGIFIELGGPLRVAIIGQLSSMLPSGSAPILKLNADVLGFFDMGAREVAIDASLFDSKLLMINLAGDLALRASWGSSTNFALSLGGFHPRFKLIPPGFPSLARLSMQLGSGNPRITFEMYYAVTSNSIQIGSRFDLYAKKKGFSIEGGAHFDALIIFNPFFFEVSVGMRVSVSGLGVSLGLGLDFTLSGPNTFRVKGYVRVKLFIKTVKVRFKATFGKQVPESLPIVSPFDVLVKELENVASLSYEMPEWAESLVRTTKASEKYLDPNANIIISQHAVPLDYSMERFGGGIPPEDEKSVAIEIAGIQSTLNDIRESFSVEQFNNWTADQRLSQPPFSELKAGTRTRGAIIEPSETAIHEKEVKFETILRESEEYLSELAISDTYKQARRILAPWSVGSQSELFVDWSLSGADAIYNPVTAAVDVESKEFVKLSGARFTVCVDKVENGKFVRSDVNGQPVGNMSFAEASRLAGATESNLANAIVIDVAQVE